MNAMAAIKVLFLLMAGCGYLFAGTDIPGYQEIDCLCNPGDTMFAAAKRSTGSGLNYKKLLPVAKDGRVIKISKPGDYKKLPLGTKVFAPEDLQPVSVGFTITSQSIIGFCQQLNPDELNTCVLEVVRLNSLKTCDVSSLTEPFKGTLFVPNRFLSALNILRQKNALAKPTGRLHTAKPPPKRAAISDMLIPAFKTPSRL